MELRVVGRFVGGGLRPGVTSLVEILRARAEDRPGNIAFSFLSEHSEARPAACGELDLQARAIAAVLQAEGASGERALLLFPAAGLDFIKGFLGCLYGGVVAIPAYPPTGEEQLPRVAAILRDAKPGTVLTSSALLPRLKALMDPLPELREVRWIAVDEIPAQAAGDWREPDITPETLAFLQYTSGSTSSPKGVMVSHGNLLHNEELIRSTFRQSEESVIVSWLPLYHDMGLIGGVLQPLYLGAHCILLSPAAFLQKPLRWLEAISRYRATTSGGPNFAYGVCLKRVRDEELDGVDLGC